MDKAGLLVLQNMLKITMGELKSFICYGLIPLLF